MVEGPGVAEIIDMQNKLRLAPPSIDMVNEPPHYTRGQIESIDAIRAALGDAGFVAYCRGAVIKYAWRAPHKANAAEDLRKCAWYAVRAAEVLEGRR